MHLPSAYPDLRSGSQNPLSLQACLLRFQICNFKPKGIIANFIELALGGGRRRSWPDIFPHLDVHIADREPGPFDRKTVDIADIVEPRTVFLRNRAMRFATEQLFIEDQHGIQIVHGVGDMRNPSAFLAFGGIERLVLNHDAVGIAAVSIANTVSPNINPVRLSKPRDNRKTSSLEPENGCV